MKKEFEINDIINAVNSISKIEKKKSENVEKKDFANKNDILFDKRVSKGTLKEIGQGLGLYNLREMLYHFDGEIQIEEPYFGKGTTFRISLPVENITRS